MFWRFIGFLFTIGIFLFVVGAAAAAFLIWKVGEDLPDYEVLARYDPPVMTRIHAGDGQLLAEYARERRLFVPIDTVPDRMIQAILSAEDKNFFEHGGIDYVGIVRAVVVNVQNRLGGGGRRLVGASTITQQVAKNFLLSSDQNVTRKLKEALLAMRIEEAFTKERILELYLNEIYLGLGAHGVAAASLNYYGKSLHQLNLQEFAYLAALPKGPTNYHPFRRTEAAVERRNWVIDRMVVNGYVTVEEAEAAKAAPLDVSPRSFGAQIFAAEYFAEEVRREVIDLYGEKRLYEGGLSVRTTLDPALQKEARRALVEGLVAFDRERGWRGPVAEIDTGGDWGSRLTEIETPDDIDPWRLAVALKVEDGRVIAGLEPEKLENGSLPEERHGVEIPLDELKWARAAQPGGGLGSEIQRAGQVLDEGDVIFVAPTGEGSWTLMQLPEIEGAIDVLDPHTGRVLAMVGGFSFSRSQFNRAVQAMRQPGSSFKPFVYAAALDNGYTPASVVMDAPIALDQGGGQGIWRPQNYGREYYGPSTLRLGIEKSRNVMTVRLAEDLGMDVVAEYARRFGIDEDLTPVLSMSLGAGETTLTSLTAAYGMLANGGKRIVPSLVDRIQDRYGRTIFRHDTRECVDCNAAEWRGQPEPVLPDNREQVIAPETAYQVTSMMEGVVQRGTATLLKKLGRPIAGKTGTTNEERDAWFIGYTPDLVIGVYVGYDTPRPMGRGETGGGLAAPIFNSFAEVALADEPVIPFRVPPGINLVRINGKTGMLAMPGEEDVIVEAFKPGELPGNSPMDVIGSEPLAPEVPAFAGTALPAASEGLTTGTGGLY